MSNYLYRAYQKSKTNQLLQLDIIKLGSLYSLKICLIKYLATKTALIKSIGTIYYIFIRRLTTVTDLIYRVVQVLRENLYQIRISAQDTGLMELVKLWDEGQLSYMTSYKPYTKRTHVLSLPTQYIEYMKTSERSNHYYREELCI